MLFSFFYKALKVRFSSKKDLYKSIYNLFGYYPDNIALYQLAFRHKSQSQDIHNGIKICNERLEYLGDAILGAVVADYLFKRFPYKEEGFLTEMRSKIVCRNNLNKLSETIGLHKYILSDKDSNNKAKSLKGDTFEAFIGAMYLDKGYKFTQKIIVDKIIHDYINIEELLSTDNNFKSKLIEYSQKEKKTLEFIVADTIGNGFQKQYIVNVVLEGKVVCKGQDYSIKGAEQNAAMKTLSKINIG